MVDLNKPTALSPSGVPSEVTGIDNLRVHIFNIVINDDVTGGTLRIWNHNIDSWDWLSVQQVGWKLS